MCVCELVHKIETETEKERDREREREKKRGEKELDCEKRSRTCLVCLFTFLCVCVFNALTLCVCVFSPWKCFVTVKKDARLFYVSAGQTSQLRAQGADLSQSACVYVYV